MNRRTFLHNTGLALAVAGTGGATLLLEGCAGILATIEAWAPVAKNAVAGFVTILGPFLPPGSTVIIAAINASIDATVAAIMEYMAAPAANKNGLLAKIQLALKDIADNVQTFLHGLNIAGNPIVSVVIGLAQVLLSTIAGFINSLPIPTPAPAGARNVVMASEFRVGNQRVAIIPKKRSLGGFKHDWNQVAEANGQSQIDLK